MPENEEMDETTDMAADPQEGSPDGEADAESGSARISRGTMGMVLLVVLAGAGIFVMYKRNGPASAGAAATTGSNDATVSQFLQGGQSNIRLMERMLQRTQDVVNQFRTYPSMAQVPLGDLSKNPFRHEQPKSPQTAADGTETTETKRQRESERQAVLKAVQGLQLGSIMHSETSRACMINSALYGEGQQVEGFTVEKITPMSVIVRKGAYRFELKMGR